MFGERTEVLHHDALRLVFVVGLLWRSSAPFMKSNLLQTLNSGVVVVVNLGMVGSIDEEDAVTLIQWDLARKQRDFFGVRICSGSYGGAPWLRDVRHC